MEKEEMIFSFAESVTQPPHRKSIDRFGRRRRWRRVQSSPTHNPPPLGLPFVL